MYKKFLVIATLLATIGLFAGLNRALAQVDLPVSALPDERAANQAPDVREYLIRLPMPRPGELDVPARLNRMEIKSTIDRLARKQAQPLLNELRGAQRRGDIAGFDLLPDQFAIAIRATAAQAGSMRAKISEWGVLEDAPAVKACLEGRASALQEQVRAMSGAKLRGESLQLSEAPASDPSINAYVYPDSDYSEIRGFTTSNTSVDLRILRGGKVITTQSGTSNDFGFYAFYPEWLDCSGYNWSILYGDVVEVSAHGNTVTTLVVPVSAWLDPGANTVEGTTEVGRSMEVRLYAANTPCEFVYYGQNVSTDGTGHFLANYTGQVDFDGQTYADVYARDANGNATFTDFYAYHFENEFTYEDFSGALKPSVPFTATLTRASTVIDTVGDLTGRDGWYFGYFSDDIQEGDVVNVTGGGAAIQFTATSFDGDLNAVSNQVVGTTGAGRRVKAGFEQRNYYPLTTSCAGYVDCATATANGSGSVNITSPIDIARGDAAWVTVYDAEGNSQYTLRNAPAIVGDLTYSELHGYWGVPNQVLDVVLKDSSDVEKISFSTWADYDGEISDYFYMPVEPEDTIQVTDGVITETMTVQNLTAQLNNNTEHLTGTAYSARLLAMVSDFHSDAGYWEYNCQETTVSGGNYNLDFSAMQIGGRDEANVYNTGPDGHYTYRYASAFRAVVYMPGADIWGYTMSPNEQVTIRMWDGSTLIDGDTIQSDYDGYFEGYFGISLAAGQRVEVLSVLSLDITLPELTINLDSLNNRIYGHSPAGHLVDAYFETLRNCGKGFACNDYADQYVFADAGGNYTASFDGFSTYDYCLPAQIGPCAWPFITDWRPDGHRVQSDLPEPDPVAADAWEGDDTFATAKAYTGLSQHTFHLATDADWISLDVNAGMLGKPLYLQTVDLGTTSDTVVELYASNGTTLLDSNDDYGSSYRSQLAWTPSGTGTYYVKVKPFATYANAGNCDSTYAFFIATSQVYLPFTGR